MDVYGLALAGGILIGLAAVVMLLFLGRIAGISGIFWGGLSAPKDSLWRWLFIGGILVGALVYHLLSGQAMPAPNLPWPYAVIGGLLVGVGTKLGSGCTSGHGVCGIGRLSLRSIAATLTFMVVAIVTLFILRHVL